MAKYVTLFKAISLESRCSRTLFKIDKTTNYELLSKGSKSFRRIIKSTRMNICEIGLIKERKHFI